MTDATHVTYPHIVRSSGVRGGEPIVEGTRISVTSLVRAHKLGLDFDEILVQFPSIGPEGLHAALLYYLDHRDEIDTALARAEEPPAAAVQVKL